MEIDLGVAQRAGGIDMAINDQAEKIGQIAFGGSPRARAAISQCVKCEKQVTHEQFTDALSIKEYGISGLCQSCQDEIFGV